ncbi:MAG: hypothetical protein WCR20_20210, partial [Verrucomicrobiota bacterium]
RENRPEGLWCGWLCWFRVVAWHRVAQCGMQSGKLEKVRKSLKTPHRNEFPGHEKRVRKVSELLNFPIKNGRGGEI